MEKTTSGCFNNNIENPLVKAINSVKSNSLFPLLIIFFSTLVFLSSVKANTPTLGGWIGSVEASKAFIENKGQFKLKNTDVKVLYAYDNGLEAIYFTPKGIVYHFAEEVTKSEKEEKEEREREGKKTYKNAAEWLAHEAEEQKREFKIDDIAFNWVGANENVQVISEDPTSDYHSYSVKQADGTEKNVNFINAFKKIIYKNLYDNIDVEYVFHPTQGIKYTIILHPGADASKIKMHYDGKCAIKLNGDLKINTLFGPIIDHAPIAYYAYNKSENIPVVFSEKNNQITFDIKPYNHSKTLVIDPWVQTPTLSLSNCVWECEKDGTGNVYIIGGDMPMKLKKYNSSGTLQWTYNTPYDTTGGSNGTGTWLGGFATDLAGNSYVTKGSESYICKVNTSGSLLWNNTSAGGGFNPKEFWNITFNCDQSKIIMGGMTANGFTDLKGAIFDMDVNNGNILSTQIVGFGTFSFSQPQQEVRSITSSRNAKYYYLTFDTIGFISQDFATCTSTPTVRTDNGYSLAYKCEDYRFASSNSGIMAIRGNKDFVYTQNGTTIQKRSLATLAVLASAPIPGGINTLSAGRHQVGNSGIDIDSCGNVYVGSGNGIVKYDANLNQLSTVSTSFKVYDVAVSTSGDVIAAGSTGNGSSSSRTGYVQSFNMLACPPMTLFCCDATVCPVGPYCTTDAPLTLSAITPGGTWSGAGITNAATGAFSPSIAGQGIHTIIYTLPCGSDSIYVTVNCCASQITPAGPFCVPDAPVTLTAASSGGTWSGTGITNASTGVFSPSVAGAGTHQIIYTASCGADTITISVGACVTLAACKETNGNITATSGNAPYSWSNQSTTQDCSACSFGVCGFPPGCEVNITSWTSFATGTTITPSGTYPIKMMDNNGDSLIITTISSLPACPSNNCPAITTAASNITAVSCGNTADGSFDAATTGGTSPWVYTLKDSTGATVSTFPNVTTTQHFSNLAAGTYTLYILDNNSCADTTVVTITSTAGGGTPANAGPDQTLCSNSAILAGNTPTSGTGVWTLLSGTGTITTPSSPTSSVTGLAVGVAAFVWTITNGTCFTSADTVAIGNTGGGPTVTIGSHNDITCFSAHDGSASAVASGGTGTLSYSWSPGGGNTPSVSNLGPGTYTVSVSDGGGCVGFATVSIAEPTVITVLVNTTPIGCGSTGSAVASATGGTANLHYLWNNGETTTSITNLTVGTYSVTVTDDMSCSQAAVGVVTQSSLTASVGPDVTIHIGDTTQLSVTGGNTMSWSPSSGLSCTTCRTPNASPLETTTYCVIVSDSVCSDTACVLVTVVDSGGCGSLFLPSGSVYTPNAFSPNHDGLNDVYKPVSNCVHNYSFMIFDRWGEKIFETTDTEVGWNGTFKGRLCQPDVYVYVVTFVDDHKNNYHQFTGKVVLLR